MNSIIQKKKIKFAEKCWGTWSATLLLPAQTTNHSWTLWCGTPLTLTKLARVVFRIKYIFICHLSTRRWIFFLFLFCSPSNPERFYLQQLCISCTILATGRQIRTDDCTFCFENLSSNFRTHSSTDCYHLRMCSFVWQTFPIFFSNLLFSFFFQKFEKSHSSFPPSHTIILLPTKQQILPSSRIEAVQTE